MANPQFHIVDYVVFVAVLVISAGIGLYYAFTGGRQKTNKEFLMANRHMKIGPVTLSLLVSFMSAILLLGFPAEMYTRGTQQWISLLGMMMACVLSTLIFVPLLYPLKLTSAFEYLELRYKSRAARLTGNLCSLVATVMYMGIALFAPSTALEAVTGFPVWATIVIVGGVATFYTTLGGMKAVVWTDVFQSAVMYAGILAVLIQGCLKVGGMHKVWEFSEIGGRIEFFNFDFDPRTRHTTWGLIISPTLMWTGVYGINQAAVQRYCSLPTRREATIAVLMNIPLLFVLVSTTCLAGITIYAYYASKGCDPLANGDISNANQLLPYFVMEVLNFPGVPGLVVASLFSGALSSISSALSSLAANLWEDIFKLKLGYLSDLQQTMFTKGIVIVGGFAAVGMALLASTFKGHVVQASFSFAGAAGGALLGMFLLGVFFPCANYKGAVTGGIIGLVIPMWLNFGAYFALKGPAVYLPTNTANCTSEFTNSSQLLLNVSYLSNGTYDVMDEPLMLTTPAAVPEVTGFNKIYTISYLWLSTIGTTTTIIVGLLISACTGIDRDVNPAYVVSFYDVFCCCFPPKCRRRLNLCCGIDTTKRDVVGDSNELANLGRRSENDGYIAVEHKRTFFNDQRNKSSTEKGGYVLVATK